MVNKTNFNQFLRKELMNFSYFTFKDKNWMWLEGIDRSYFKDDQLIGCFSVFAESKGIFVILTHSDVISLKLVVTGNKESPLELEELVRIKGLRGKTYSNRFGN
jgi:hypothetical protein